MPRRKKTPTAPESASGEAVTSIKYPATRKNIPPAGLPTGELEIFGGDEAGGQIGQGTNVAGGGQGDRPPRQRGAAGVDRRP